MLKFVVPALCAVSLLAFGLAAWSFSNGHRNACESRDATLNVVRDVIRLTEPTPAARDRLPAERRDAVDRFYTFTYQRIDEARC